MSDEAGAQADAGWREREKRRVLRVKPGASDDACPLCGIHRQNAGFLKETCGEGYLAPECFVEGARDGS